MDIRTLISDATNWMFSDMNNVLCVIGAIAVIGAINGIRISIGRCSGRYNGRIL